MGAPVAMVSGSCSSASRRRITTRTLARGCKNGPQSAQWWHRRWHIPGGPLIGGEPPCAFCGFQKNRTSWAKRLPLNLSGGSTSWLSDKVVNGRWGVGCSVCDKGRFSRYEINTRKVCWFCWRCASLSARMYTRLLGHRFYHLIRFYHLLL